ncbi:MAG TPA: bacillithiol biosynthesis cysteine-adding enzyme BshC [Terracidiphilus sp.]|nr:bacillithiol biosynthesis cysteine-adding enzyme BshC [Terracidiphilus sp.]
MHPLFLDFCARAPQARNFYGFDDRLWQARPPIPAHGSDLLELIAEQNPQATAAASLESLRQGAGVVVTGQQVGLFGGPLFTPFKAATALARARQATAQGKPHVAVFWVATEDHDFDEINHVTFPSRKELRRLAYVSAPATPVPVGRVVLDDSITGLLEEAWQLVGQSEAIEALAEAYRPGRTFGEAFAEFYRKAFATSGLLVLDAGGRAAHRMGAPVLRAALERADELHAALQERNAALEAAGYHVQVAVADQSSLLFLIDAETGARVALKRTAPTAGEPDGLWHAGSDRFSNADLIGILEAEPERISPSALLRPVFQDYLLSSSLTIGGPAEIAYFAQSAELYGRILGRMTPVEPRLSATLVEPPIGELLRKHELTLERIFSSGNADELAQLLAARAMPIEGKRKLAAAGNAMDTELDALVEWLKAMDNGLGQSADTAASKMRYQMNRLRQIAANFQLQKEESLKRHADAISRAIYPDGVPQERVHGAAYYFGRYGFQLAETLTEQAMDICPGHKEIWL